MKYEQVKNRLTELGLTSLNFVKTHTEIEKMLNDKIPIDADENLYQCLLDDNNIKAIEYACLLRGVPTLFSKPEIKGQTFYELISLVLPPDEVRPYFENLYGKDEGGRIFIGLGGDETTCA